LELFNSEMLGPQLFKPKIQVLELSKSEILGPKLFNSEILALVLALPTALPLKAAL
jgi:hypothetical protein